MEKGRVGGQKRNIRKRRKESNRRVKKNEGEMEKEELEKAVNAFRRGIVEGVDE